MFRGGLSSICVSFLYPLGNVSLYKVVVKIPKWEKIPRIRWMDEYRLAVFG
jgi:hypothetical protein